jgi:hypothetical protein
VRNSESKQPAPGFRTLFDGLAQVDGRGLTVFWGVTGCSLRIAVSDRSPVSVSRVFPPGPPCWMGVTDLTLGWYEDASGLLMTPQGRAVLHAVSGTAGHAEARPGQKPA